MGVRAQVKAAAAGIAICVFALFATSNIAAGPADLEQWNDWVLDQYLDSGCPWRMSRDKQRVCSWPGNLALNLTPEGLAFDFKVDVYRDRALVQIPGDPKYWPDSVSVNGKSAPVVENDDRPWVSLSHGVHRLKGWFRWKQKPNALTIPAGVAFVTLLDSGKSLAIDRRGDQIFFSQKRPETDTRQRDSLTVEVYRRLNDGVPPTLETRLKLSVSGKPREIKLGRVALEGTEVMELSSPLPARIEADGDIRIQVVAGEHQIRVLSRFLSNIATLKTQPSGNAWPDYEYFSFSADPAIRQVQLSGAVSVDNSQITLPSDWSDLPTYRLDENSTLQIETQYRGDHTPLSNQLNIVRALWLDFDGRGITALENVTGRMSRDWRLDARPDTRVGRATVAGEPVLITENQGRQGIEIRSPEIKLSAVTRVADPGEFSVNGWDARADSFQATLHLPPGWRVMHASGVDNVWGTWISQWNLWDIFLLLIMVMVTRKLLGNRPAIVAAAALVISYHEPGVPLVFYPFLLLILALLGVLFGRWKRRASLTAAGLSALLVLALIGFAVTQFRTAIYPTLEKGQLSRYQVSDAISYQAGLASFTADQLTMEKPGKERRLAEQAVDLAEPKPAEDMYQVDEKDRVQTGPGLPTWLWNQVNLRSTSPVAEDQVLSIVYCPPWLTGLWRIVSVFLMAAYALLLMRDLVGRGSFKRAGGGAAAGPATAVAMLMVFLASVFLPSQPARAAEFPPKYLMKQLEEKLLKAPECLPGCASINRGELVVDEESAQLSFEVYADADIALPIPMGNAGWSPGAVSVDNFGEVPAAKIDGQDLVLVGKGHHKVVLTGNIIGDQASISFPLVIHNFSVVAEHWQVDGLIDGRIPSKTLSLRTKVKNHRGQEDNLIADPVAPFVIVYREFYLGKRWSMTTRVERVAPSEGPIAVGIPLLPFEEVLSESSNIKDGKVLVQFSSRQQRVQWQSILQPVEQIQLTAADDTSYMETWRISPSSLWHLTYAGLPPVKEADQASSLRPQWKPWPGETLTIDISRPEGVQGPTSTVEEAVLNYEAGKRLQKSKLDIDVRSSLGENYGITLPEGSEILSLAIDGDKLNIPMGNRITVPLRPGLQKLKIEFQEREHRNWFGETPEIQLSGHVANISLHYELPRDRWPLFISGPAIGPAMLYWGVLCVIILGAILLSLLARRLGLDIPVNLLDWLLLGIGLSTVNSYGAIFVATFFFLLAIRKQRVDPAQLGRRSFNSVQLFLVFWTAITVLVLIAAIPMGLLSDPNMIVVGNGSYSHLYNFYQDRSGAGSFPTVSVYSLSLTSYRVVMLLWSLWLAMRIIRWAQWWWSAYSAKGVWQSTGV